MYGVSTVSNDSRDVDAEARKGNHDSLLAMKLWGRRVADFIGQYFVRLGGCDLLVGDGFANAAMRALACGHDIKKYKKPKHDCELWADLEGQSFDAIIVEMALDSFDLKDFTVEDCFNACNRIVKDGGEILLCLSKKSVLGDDTAFLRQFVSRERTLQAVVQLPSGKILFHFVKQP